MKIYINLQTGEVIIKRTLLGAKRYFKNDAKQYGYTYSSKHIVRFKG